MRKNYIKSIAKMLVCFMSTTALLPAVHAHDTVSNEDIIKEVAFAYQRQSAEGQSFYDQYNSRRHLYATPEDSTSQRTVYLDCSSYVNSCYMEAFGVNVLPYEITEKSPSTANYYKYAQEFIGQKDDVIGYWENGLNEGRNDYDTSEEREEITKFVYENIEIGDVLTYRHGTESSGYKGHVYMYIGDNKYIHRAGAPSYNVNTSNPALSYDQKEGETGIGTITASKIFEEEGNDRYIFRLDESDPVISFSILRPLARGLTPTAKALARMKIAGLTMEKTASVFENNSVNTGDTLTYTVTLKNTTTAAIENVVISDTLPVGTEFVSGSTGVSANGRSLSWAGSVAAGATVNVTYNVRITADVPGTLIKSNATYVSGIKLGNITHTVSGYTKGQQTTLANKANDFIESSKTGKPVNVVNSLYKEALGFEPFEYATPEEILDQVIDSTNLTCRTDTKLSKMLVPNLYGGLDIKSGYIRYAEHNDRTRLVSKEELAVGDIIFAEWSGGNVAYVYMGDSKLLSAGDGTCKALTIGDNIYVSGDNILISLLAYDRFAVLRPSMAAETAESSVPAYFEIGRHQDTEVVYLEGKIDNTSNQDFVTILIKNDEGNIAYIGEYETDNVGRYSAKFPVKGSGTFTYSVKAGNTDVTESVTIASINSNGVFVDLWIADSNGGETVTAQSLISAGATIKNKYSYNDAFKFILAFYDTNDRLIKCKISDEVSVEFDDINSTKEFPYGASAPENTAKVKAFAWKDVTNLVPFGDDAEVEF